MRIVSIDHVNLVMPAGGEPKAIEFYSNVLGITNIPKPPVLAKRGGCWFEDGTLRIHLSIDPDFRPARKAHVALIVDDLAGLVTRLKEAGCEVIGDDELDGVYRVFTYDPFGNRIELIQKT